VPGSRGAVVTVGEAEMSGWNAGEKGVIGGEEDQVQSSALGKRSDSAPYPLTRTGGVRLAVDTGGGWSAKSGVCLGWLWFSLAIPK